MRLGRIMLKCLWVAEQSLLWSSWLMHTRLWGRTMCCDVISYYCVISGRTLVNDQNFSKKGTCIYLNKIELKGTQATINIHAVSVRIKRRTFWFSSKILFIRNALNSFKVSEVEPWPKNFTCKKLDWANALGEQFKTSLLTTITFRITTHFKNPLFCNVL